MTIYAIADLIKYFIKTTSMGNGEVEKIMNKLKQVIGSK